MALFDNITKQKQEGLFSGISLNNSNQSNAFSGGINLTENSGFNMQTSTPATSTTGGLDMLKSIGGSIISGIKEIPSFLASLPKQAAQDLLVNPVVRSAQLVSSIANLGDGATQGTEDLTLKTLFGTYTIPAQKPYQGLMSGANEQIVGGALKTASWLIAPESLAGVGKSIMTDAAIQSIKTGAPITEEAVRQAFTNTVAQGFKSGALIGGINAAGNSMYEGKNALQVAQDTATGALVTGLFGGATAGIGTGIKIAVNKTKFIQDTLVKELVSQGMSKEQATAFATQGGYIKNPLAKGETPVPSLPEQTPSNRGTGGEIAPRTPAEIQTNSDVSSFYNLNKLNISSQAKQSIQSEIDNAGVQIEKTVGKTLTNKEVLDLANNSSQILNKTVTREQTAMKIAADLKLRQKIADVAESGNIDKDFINLWIKDKAAGEDIARQLQARKIGADPRNNELVDTILSAIYKVNKNADEIAKQAKGVDFTNPEEVALFYRKFVKPKTSEWIDLLRYNSMLTSPNTHIINTASNLEGTGVIAPIEKTITGLLDATRSALTGNPRQYAVGEGVAYAKGYWSNLSEATKTFIKVMKGEQVITQPDVRQIPLSTGGVTKAVEKTLNFPLRLLEGMDQFFKAMTEGGLESAQTYATSKGISRNTNIAEEASSRLFRGQLHAPQQGYVLDAVDSLTNVIQQARNSNNQLLSTIAKFTLPFVRTPTEIFKQGIEYSPLGISTLPGASNKIEQLSKIILGTSAAAGAATLLGQNRLTWAKPVNPTQAKEFDASGRQPYAIKIGDKWISYSKLHPALAFNFALISALDDSLKNKKLSDGQADTVLQSVAKVGNFLADQSYVRNIGDFVSATQGTVSGWAKLISNYPSQLVPFRALASWIERIIDPVQRQVDPDGSILDKQLQNMMLQFPGLASKVPVKLDTQGNPIPNTNRNLNAISPNKITSTSPEQEKLYQAQQDYRKQNQIETEQRAIDKGMIQPIYDKAQELLKQGKTQEADAIVQALSPQDQQTYLTIRASERAKNTSKLHELIATDPAQAVVFVRGQNEREKERLVKLLNDKDSFTDKERQFYTDNKPENKPMIEASSPQSNAGGTMSKLLGALSGAKTAYADTIPPSSNAMTPERIKAEIAFRESGTSTAPYTTVGVTKDLGKYQVNPATLKSYSQQFLGKNVTPQEFLNSPKLQETFMEEAIKHLQSKGAKSLDAFLILWHRGWGDISNKRIQALKKEKEVQSYLNNKR